jgi:demethylmenaquinone methyltransferase/2-methoxy-6-polyprenyl-1,4-benzoquinol methylase
MSFGTGRRYRRLALKEAGLQPGMRVLDVASGTGLLAKAAVEISGSSSRVFAVEPSMGMIQYGKHSAGAPFVRAVAESLPICDSQIDFVVKGYALRHVADLIGTFREFRRVLRHGGRLLILEITRPSSKIPLAMMHVHIGHLVPWLIRLTTTNSHPERIWHYYWETILHCVPPTTVVNALWHAGFVDVQWESRAGIFAEFRARCP